MKYTPSLLLLVLLALSIKSRGQLPDTSPVLNRKVEPYHKGWSLSFNPLGLLEFQTAAGLGIGYQWNERWQLWLESSVLFKGPLDPDCKGGFRESLALKYFFGTRHNFFVAAEFRWRQVSYRDSSRFVNAAARDTLNNYGYTLKNVLPGGSVWMGMRIPINKSHRFWLEPSIGVGLKYRTATVQGVPVGYHYPPPIDHLNPFPRTQSGLVPYFPASIRVFYGF
ncbi:MAG TPA: hypothetical protein VK518_12590 [Puia sp.]|nr:hypothetical protein [Puia sp.]